MEIRYLTHKEIDFDKWDHCISNAANSFIYAYSFYLDAMAKNWDALVFGDYEMVMPLPCRKKWFIHYIYPPAFTQQLGLFSKNPVTREQLQEFIVAIPAKFKFIEMDLNFANQNLDVPKIRRQNYLLPLNQDYDSLRSAYSRMANRNIRKALSQQIVVVENMPHSKIIALHRKRFNDKIGVSEADYFCFENALKMIKSPAGFFSIGALNPTNELIAGNIYLVNKNRLCFILTANTDAGMQSGAAHLLKDYVIKKYAGQNFILDFEGSETKSFARFYEQFNARPAEKYFKIILNRLPWPLHYFKK